MGKVQLLPPGAAPLSLKERLRPLLIALPGGRALSAFGAMLATSSETGFAAARWNRLTADWTSWRRSADQTILQDLGALRARARNLVLNNPYAKRFAQEVSKNVAGPVGFRLKAKVRDANGELMKDVNQALVTDWRSWCRKGNCTVDGRYSFGALQRLIMRVLPTDGEVILRKIQNFPNAWGYALQLLDADQLDEQMNRRASERETEVRMGVEMDRWGRATTYNFFREHPAEIGGREHFPAPAAEVCHLYIPFMTGQSRGIPWTHSVLLDLRHLDKYQEAELVAAFVAASKMGFFVTTEEGMAIWQPPASDKVERVQMEVEPGLLSQLPPGLKFESWDPQHPNAAYPDFMRGVLHAISAGLDVAYHNLTGDLEGVNYSSARIGELDERDEWKALQNYFIEHFLDDVFSDWVKSWLLRTPRPLPSYDPAFYIENVAWLPRGWDWVDPESELNAMEKAIQLGLTSRTREAAARGVDFEEVLEELSEEEDLAEELGVAISTDSAMRKDLQQPQSSQDSGEGQEQEQPGRLARLLRHMGFTVEKKNGGRHTKRGAVIQRG